MRLSRGVLVIALVLVVASVGAYGQTYSVFDDFEDGDVDGWTLSGQGDRFITTDSISDNWAMQVEATGTESTLVSEKTFENDENLTAWSFEFRTSDSVNTGVTSDSTGVGLRNGTTCVGAVTWLVDDYPRDLYWFNGTTGDQGCANSGAGNFDTGFDLQKDTNYRVEVYDIDTDTDQAKLRVTNLDTGAESELGTFGFPASRYPVDRFTIGIELGNSAASNNVVMIVDDFQSSAEPRVLVLDVDRYMEHGSSQTYTVTFNGNDVTDSATVTSSDSDVVFVDGPNNKLLATNNESINEEVTITANYSNVSVDQNVTVASKTLDNIGMLPPATWPIALLGQPGDTDGATATWPGAVQLQWLFVCVSVGAILAWRARNAFLGVASAEVLWAFGWAVNWVSDGLLMASILFVVYIAWRGTGAIGSSNPRMD